MIEQSQKIRIKGRGVHTGEPGSVTLERLEPDGPHRIELVGREHPLSGEDFVHSQFEARFGTVLRLNKYLLNTPEHLWAVLAACLPGLRVRIEGNEIPVMDGSALPWFDAAQRLLFGPPGDFLHFSSYSTNLKAAYCVPEGYFEVSPDDVFNVEYILQLGEGPMQCCAFSLSHSQWKKQLVEHIFPARTFATWRGFLEARKAGLLKGAGENSGWLMAESMEEYREARKALPLMEFGEYPTINRLPWRMEGEAASHKILDLIGDLALYNFSLPRVKIRARNSGHFQNHQLLKDLRYEQYDK